LICQVFPACMPIAVHDSVMAIELIDQRWVRVASRVCKQVVATDCHDAVLQLLHQNAALQHDEQRCRTAPLACDPPTSTMQCSSLLWGSVPHHSPLYQSFDLVIGSDVVYQQQVVCPLLHTAKDLLDRQSPNARLVLCYCNRVDAVRTRLLQEAAALGGRVALLPVPDCSAELWFDASNAVEIIEIRFV
jgi:predicted nicotinamide N-methyase